MVKKIAKYLWELSRKSAAALPGIIASIAGFVLKSAGNIINFAAEHIILFLITVVSAIIFGLVNMIKNK